MPITLTAPPTVVEGARSYAEHSGMTLEAFVLAYLESAAKNEQKRRERKAVEAMEPTFFDTNVLVMNSLIAIESLVNTLGNKRDFAITVQNSEIIRCVCVWGGVNYSLITLADNLYLHSAARAAFSVAAPLCFFIDRVKSAGKQGYAMSQCWR